MSFHSAYQEMIKRHEQKPTGERLRRLNEGHGHAERMFMEHVWWPAFRDFENLHQSMRSKISATESAFWTLLM